MTIGDNIQLIDTMTLLIKIQVKSCTEGLLAIEPMAKKVRDPFLKKGLMMCTYGYSIEYIKETLQSEINSSDTYYNILVEGVVMVANQFADPPRMMLERFKSHLSTEAQLKLDCIAGALVKEFDEMCQRKEVPN